MMSDWAWEMVRPLVYVVALLTVMAIEAGILWWLLR